MLIPVYGVVAVLVAWGTGDVRTAVAGAAVFAFVVYLIRCWLWPFAACLWCKGGRKYEPGSRKAWKRCGPCRGTGQRLRVGRWLWNAFNGRRKAAKR